MAFNQGFGTFNNSNVGVPNFRKTATGVNQQEDPFDIKNSELFKNSSNLATQQMSGELPGWTEQSNISREAFQSAQAAQNKAKREALINSGLRDNGAFLDQGYVQPAAEQQRSTMDFERNLLAERANQVRATQQAGQQSAGNLLGFLQTQGEGALNRVSQEKIASENNAVQREQIASNQQIEQSKLAETARQYNMTFDQINQQYKDDLKFKYEDLDANKQQFYASLGLDKEKFDQAKYEFEKNYSLEDKIQTKSLDLKEQEIANQVSQFNSRLDFDKSELAANLDDKAKDRIWQAVQNDKALANSREVAIMQNDTERWKTLKTEELTKVGWSVEDARAAADRQQQLTITNLNNALTREIEAGRITEEQAARLEQVRQFNTQQAWTEKAAQMGIDAAQAQRDWATNERLGAEAAAATQATFQAQLQKELAAGTWIDANGNTVNSMDAKNLIEKAREFDDAQSWAEEAAKQGFNSWDAMRAYEKKEVIEQREWDLKLQNMQDNLTREGWNMTAINSALETLPPEQAAQLLNKFAIGAGLSYPVKDENGNVMKDKDGNVITEPGFETSKQTIVKSKESLATFLSNAQGPNGYTANGASLINAFKNNGNVTDADVKNIASSWNAYTQEFPTAFVDGNYLESNATVSWYDGKGSSTSRRWALTPEIKTWVGNNTGKLYKSNDGNIYQIVGLSDDRNKANSTGKVVLRDIKTGNTVYYSNGAGDSQKLNFAA